MTTVNPLRPAPGTPRPYHFPHFTHDRLENGLTVWTVPLPDRDLVSVHLLVDGGASRLNMMSGDAPDCLFTFSTFRSATRDRSSREYYAYFSNPYSLARVITLFVTDVLLELWANLRSRFRGLATCRRPGVKRAAPRDPSRSRPRSSRGRRPSRSCRAGGAFDPRRSLRRGAARARADWSASRRGSGPPGGTSRARGASVESTSKPARAGAPRVPAGGVRGRPRRCRSTSRSFRCSREISIPPG